MFAQVACRVIFVNAMTSLPSRYIPLLPPFSRRPPPRNNNNNHHNLVYLLIKLKNIKPLMVVLSKLACFLFLFRVKAFGFRVVHTATISVKALRYHCHELDEVSKFRRVVANTHSMISFSTPNENFQYCGCIQWRHTALWNCYSKPEILKGAGLT